LKADQLALVNAFIIRTFEPRCSRVHIRLFASAVQSTLAVRRLARDG
jgi:hypothetical protein